ncbi:MAG TPA: TetR/AcrR family transcriptional regulator [Rhizomicrobium sp.]
MTRDRIFTAAKAIFDREGLAGLSVRAVAKAVGLTPMAIYRHYADKDALVDALMLDGFAEWQRIAAAIRTKDPVLWLRRLLDAYLDFAIARPHRFDAAFILPARGARKYPRDFAAGRSPVIASVFVHIERAKREGRLRGAPTLEIALTMSALAQGMVSMHRARRFSGDKELRTLYRAVIAHGIASFARPPGRKSG